MFLLKCLYQDNKSSAFREAFVWCGLTVSFVAAAGGTPGVVPSVLLQVWVGLVWIWGEELIRRDGEMLQNILIYPSSAKGLPLARLALCFFWDARALPSQTDKTTPSQHEPLLGTPLHLQSWLYPTFLPSWHALYLHSHLQLHAEVFLPQLPVAGVVAADCLQISVSSRGINASMPERQGEAAVLNVSLPASAFSLTS